MPLLPGLPCRRTKSPRRAVLATGTKRVGWADSTAPRRTGDTAMDSGNDAYKPAQIADLIETVGVAKAALPLGQMLALASAVVLQPAFLDPAVQLTF